MSQIAASFGECSSLSKEAARVSGSKAESTFHVSLCLCALLGILVCTADHLTYPLEIPSPCSFGN